MSKINTPTPDLWGEGESNIHNTCIRCQLRLRAHARRVIQICLNSEVMAKIILTIWNTCACFSEVWVSFSCLPDLQVQYQETAVCNVLKAPGQVTQGLENLLPAAFTLTNLTVCWGWRRAWVGRVDKRTHTDTINKRNHTKLRQQKRREGLDAAEVLLNSHHLTSNTVSYHCYHCDLSVHTPIYCTVPHGNTHIYHFILT